MAKLATSLWNYRPATNRHILCVECYCMFIGTEKWHAYVTEAFSTQWLAGDHVSCCGCNKTTDYFGMKMVGVILAKHFMPCDGIH